MLKIVCIIHCIVCKYAISNTLVFVPIEPQPKASWERPWERPNTEQTNPAKCWMSLEVGWPYEHWTHCLQSCRHTTFPLSWRYRVKTTHSSYVCFVTGFKCTFAHTFVVKCLCVFRWSTWGTISLSANHLQLPLVKITRGTHTHTSLVIILSMSYLHWRQCLSMTSWCDSDQVSLI